MAKKKTVGIGKTRHWTEGRRVKNARKKLKNRVRNQSPENQAKAIDIIEIGRQREGGGKQHQKGK